MGGPDGKIFGSRSWHTDQVQHPWSILCGIFGILIIITFVVHRNAGIPFLRQETEGNMLLKATEAAEKLIKVTTI